MPNQARAELDEESLEAFADRGYINLTESEPNELDQSFRHSQQNCSLRPQSRHQPWRHQKLDRQHSVQDRFPPPGLSPHHLVYFNRRPDAFDIGILNRHGVHSLVSAKHTTAWTRSIIAEAMAGTVTSRKAGPRARRLRRS